MCDKDTTRFSMHLIKFSLWNEEKFEVHMENIYGLTLFLVAKIVIFETS